MLFVTSRAGRSPTFQDPGTPLFGLAGTRGFASLIEESFYLDSDSRFLRGLVSTRVPGYPFTALVTSQHEVKTS